jgi:carbon storage regulator
MLVLTRKLLEKIYIGDDVCVTVVRVEGGQVRLGVDAPRNVVVVRGELRARDALAKARAAEHASPGETVKPGPPAARGTDSPRREPSH